MLHTVLFDMQLRQDSFIEVSTGSMNISQHMENEIINKFNGNHTENGIGTPGKKKSSKIQI